MPDGGTTSGLVARKHVPNLCALVKFGVEPSNPSRLKALADCRYKKKAPTITAHRHFFHKSDFQAVEIVSVGQTPVWKVRVRAVNRGKMHESASHPFSLALTK